MKVILVLLFITVFDLKSFACGQPEAQIITTVDRVEFSKGGCVAKFNFESIQLFTSSLVCPLLIEEVVQEGISYPSGSVAGCSIKAGDEVSGVVFRDMNGVIALEK